MGTNQDWREKKYFRCEDTGEGMLVQVFLYDVPSFGVIQKSGTEAFRAISLAGLMNDYSFSNSTNIDKLTKALPSALFQGSFKNKPKELLLPDGFESIYGSDSIIGTKAGECND